MIVDIYQEPSKLCETSTYETLLTIIEWFNRDEKYNIHTLLFFVKQGSVNYFNKIKTTKFFWYDINVLTDLGLVEIINDVFAPTEKGRKYVELTNNINDQSMKILEHFENIREQAFIEKIHPLINQRDKVFQDYLSRLQNKK